MGNPKERIKLALNPAASSTRTSPAMPGCSARLNVKTHRCRALQTRIQLGHGYCAQLAAAPWLSSSTLTMALTLEEARARARSIEQYGRLFYTTCVQHTPDHHRRPVVFACPETVTPPAPDEEDQSRPRAAPRRRPGGHGPCPVRLSGIENAQVHHIGGTISPEFS